MPCDFPLALLWLSLGSGARRTTEATCRRGCSNVACRVVELRRSECWLRNGDCPQAASVAAPAMIRASLKNRDMICPSVAAVGCANRALQCPIVVSPADLAGAVAGQSHAAR